MKRFFLFSVILLTLINWFPTQAEAQAPTVTIAPPTDTQTGAFNVTITFSAAVNGFTEDDVTLDAGAKVTDFTGSNGASEYTVQITPKVTGDVTISVAANVATSTVGGQSNTASSSHTVTVDLPHQIMVMEPDGYDEDVPYKDAFEVMIMFTEGVDSFTASNITLSPSGLATVTVDGTAPTFTATITPVVNKEGTLSIQIAENIVEDTSEVGYPASNEIEVKVDTDRPTVTEIDVPSDPQSGAFDITIEFSEDVYGFDPTDDINLGGGANATAILKNGNDGDAEYTVTITPTRSGNLTIDVKGDAVADAAGNKSAGSSQETVTIDVDAPTVEISDLPTGTQTDDFTVAIEFSEDVTGFTKKSDVTLSPSSLASVKTLTGSGDEYTATITPQNGEQGDLTISVAAGVAEDDAENGNEASNEVTVAVDKKKPTVTFSGLPATPKNIPFDVTTTFSEDVTGFTKSDITLSPSSLASVTRVFGSGASYTVRIAPASSEQGEVTISVEADAVTDTAGNSNDASGTETVTVDLVNPRVTTSGASQYTEDSRATGPIDVTFTFSEPITGFEASDFIFENSRGTAEVKSGENGDSEYVVTITPNAGLETHRGLLFFRLPRESVQDLAGNPFSSQESIFVYVDTKKPTVSSITGVPNTAQSGAFDVKFNFSERVSGFTKEDLAVTGEARATATRGSGQAWFATITPNANKEGNVTLQVKANAVTDDSGNGNTASAVTAAIAIDTVKPTVTIGTVPAGTQKDPFDVTVTFSEDVTGFAAGDIALNPSSRASVTDVSGSGDEYMVEITPTAGAEGNVTFRVKANAAEDAAGNSNDASGTKTVNVDNKKPTVTFSGIPGTPQKNPFDVTVTFSETITGFTDSDITLSDTDLATMSVSGSGTSRTARITPKASKEGELTLAVAANAVMDTAGNGNAATTSNAFSIDKVVPTVSITNLPSTAAGAFDVTVTFSEVVTGFAANDVTVTGDATVTNVGSPNSNNAYTVTITPDENAAGNVTLQVRASAVQDLAGNANTASAVTAAIPIDATKPAVKNVGLVPTGAVGSSEFRILITFTEAVSGFAVGDVTLTPSGLATARLTDFGTSGERYNLYITPNANKEDELTATLKANAVRDAANNENDAATLFTVDIDTIGPTVAISGAPNTEQNEPFDLTVTFSEPVKDFAASDLTVTGPATASLKSGSAGDSVYTVTITPDANDEANVTVKVKASAVTDNTDNANTTTSNTVSFRVDTIVPVAFRPSGSPATEQNAAFDLVCSFQEPVKGFAADDLVVTGPATASLKSGGDGSTHFTVTITPDPASEGDVRVNVKANAVTDNAGNSNTSTSLKTPVIHVDTIVPTATITVLSGEKKEVFDATITFDEAVTGFQQSDITLTGEATLTGLTGSGASYTAKITPNAAKEGDVTLKVNANTVVDAAGNANTAVSDTVTIHIDTIMPTVTISTPPTAEQKDPFDLTITFSEDVNGFAAGDLTVTGPATAGNLSAGTLNGEKEVYTVTITPNPTDEGDVTVQVKASAVTDNAGNANTASAETAPGHVDTVLPTALISGVPDMEKNGPFDLTINFNEEVNGFAVPGDLAVTGSATAALKSSTAKEGVYVVTITPNATFEGPVTVKVKANAVQDFALNTNTATSNTASIHIDTIVPTVTVTVLSGEKNDPFDVTITFSEAVKGFLVSADLTLTGHATAALKSGAAGDTVYVVTITPNAAKEGGVTVKVDANAVTDAAGNANTAASNTASIHIDTIVPTVTISTPPTAAQKDPFDLTITFSEDVNGFAVGDLTVTGPATAGNLSAGTLNGDEEVYTVTITPNPTDEGNVTVQVNASAVTDLAGNLNTDSTVTAAVPVDTMVPTAMITGVPNTEQNGAFVVTVTFSEAVTGFAAADVAVTGDATVTNVGSPNNNAYPVTITPNAGKEGDVTLQVKASAVTDAALNANTASTVTSTVHIDTIVPTVMVTPPSGEQKDPFDVTITFSEAVNGFLVSADLTLTGPATAALKSGAAGEAVYVVTITPDATSENAVTVQVDANAVTDAAGNANTAASNTASIHIDTTVPTVTISTPPTAAQKDPFVLTITFSEDVNGFAVGDLTVTGPATAGNLSAGTLNGDEEVYTVTITPNPTSEGNVTVQVNASAVTDLAGNLNTASTVTAAVPVDTIVPTAMITGVPNTEQNGAFVVTVTFSEAVTDFAAADVAVTGEATVTNVDSPDADEYTLTITPNAGKEGNVTLQVKASAVTDAALNANTASAVTAAVHIDTIVPTVTVTPPSGEQKDPFDVTITFSEAVNGFLVSADLTLTGPATAAPKSGVDGDAVYVVTITPDATSENAVTVQVDANAVTDNAGNANTAASNTASIHIDTTVPTVTISTPPTAAQKDPFVLTITFSEDVNGFAVGDLTVTGPATAGNLSAGTLNGDEEVYTVTITPDPLSEGDVTVQVNASTVTDLAGNLNTASTVTAAVPVDTIVPTATITGVPNTEQNGAFVVTVTFSEAVTDFAAADVAVTGDATVTNVGSPNNNAYPVTITPNANKEGDVTLQVKASAVTDAALNANTASAVTAAVHIDTIVPTVTVTPPSGEQKDLFDVTITFSEAVNGFAVPADLTLTGPATAAPKSGVDGDAVYVVTITPDATSENAVTVQVDASAVTDIAGNANTAASNTASIHIDTIVPTVTISTPPIVEQKDPFDLTITFSEDVNGFAVGDLTVTGPATAGNLSAGTLNGEKEVYTVTITPNTTSEGDVTVTVNVSTVTDLAGNLNTASAETAAVHVDTIVPTVISITDVPNTAIDSAFDVSITFSETVTGFATDDVIVNNILGAEVRATATAVSGTGASYTATITPNSDIEGGITLRVKANAVTDAAGNNNTASAATTTIQIDTIPPTVEISAPPTAEQKDPFNLTITFSEDVLNFLQNDLTLTGPATLTALSLNSGSIATYTATITPNPNAESDVTVTVNANAVRDAANNFNTAASNTVSVHVDTIVPTVTISAPPTTAQKDPFVLTVTFSEDVNGFAAGDLTVTGPATAGNLSAGTLNGEEEVYTVTITPNPIAEGDVTVQVNASAVTDLAGNLNTASAVTAAVHVDTIVPTVTISGEPLIEMNVPFVLTVTFSEPVNGFAAADVTVTGPASATSATGNAGDTIYTVTITPDPTFEGDVTVQVNAGGVQDLAGNDNTASPVSVTVHVDTIVPTVVISGVPPPLPEKNIPFDLTVTFSEPVNGFAVPADLTVTGPATAVLTSGIAGTSVYTVTITPNPIAEGDVTVQVNANAVQDLALNVNTAASAATPPIHVDTIVPTVAISGVPPAVPEKNIPFDLTITFSEAVNGFAAADLTVTGPATAILAVGVPGGSVYTVTITPNPIAEGDVTVQVNANAVQDFALNANTAASAVTPAIHVDTIVPTVAISGVPPAVPEKNIPFDLTVTFSEPVNGFAVPADLTVTGPATASPASVTEGASVYTVTITPNATSEGDVTVQVNANAVQDFALNANTAPSAVTPSIHVDTIVPTVSVAVTPPTVGAETGYPTEERNSPYVLTVTFSEEVNNFAVPDDLTVNGPATASLTEGDDGDAEYTVTITPNANVEGSDVTVQVNANAVQDFALNNNTASNAPSVHVDTLAPTVTLEDVPVIEKRNDVFDITVIFSEEVNGFEMPADMTLDGPATAAVTAGADGDTEYTVTVTPNPNSRGDLTFLVNAAGVRDFALNANTESEVTDAVRIDTAPPVAEITNLPTITGAPFDITITFNEQVNGFTTEDIALTGPATALLKSGVDGDEVYIATITPDANAKGDVHIQIPAGVVKDLALNDNIASEITPAIHVDTNALTVQITDVPETVQLEAFSVMIKFSMDVADFVLTDITISGDAVIQTSELSGRGKVYALKITPGADTDGDVIIQVPADVATDAASNRNAASIPQIVSVAPSWMPDGGLRDAAREVLGLDAGEDFEKTELKKLTTLTVESSDVSTLTGLETATDLTALDLSGNAITDISLLSGLTKLTTLDLSGNAITDITALQNLTELTMLDLGGNAITDITALQNLTELTALDISGNAITDITALQNLTELTTLDISGNAITDITSLSGLTKLTTLNLSDNPISNWGTLVGLTTLTTLELSGNSINDLTVISGLTGLLTLNLSDNAITDITLLGTLTALTSLDLSSNTVSDLTPLTTLTQLTTLNLNNNTVSDLTALGGLTTLTTLELAGNTISTLSAIATLQQLRVLDLSDNTITDVSTLASLANLTTLRLMGNPILDTTSLYALTQRVPPVDIDIAVSQYTPWDVNADGSVDAADSALVTAALGQTGEGILDPRTDVNGDGTVDNADLLLVTGNFDEVPGAPTVADILRLLDPATVARLDREVLQTELQRLVLGSDGSLKYRRAIELLQRVLAAKHPNQTRLFANYPNPFNPETWIPYRLAVGSNVEITIYDVKGVVVRHLKLGHQAAGYYTQKSGAAYWDGRNAVGERVASGVYFYQLQADNVSLLRKMVILK